VELIVQKLSEKYVFPKEENKPAIAQNPSQQGRRRSLCPCNKQSSPLIKHGKIEPSEKRFGLLTNRYLSVLNSLSSIARRHKAALAMHKKGKEIILPIN
jgi:hypothetical protein